MPAPTKDFTSIAAVMNGADSVDLNNLVPSQPSSNPFASHEFFPKAVKSSSSLHANYNALSRPTSMWSNNGDDELDAPAFFTREIDFSGGFAGMNKRAASERHVRIGGQALAQTSHNLFEDSDEEDYEYEFYDEDPYDGDPESVQIVVGSPTVTWALTQGSAEGNDSIGAAPSSKKTKKRWTSLRRFSTSSSKANKRAPISIEMTPISAPSCSSSSAPSETAKGNVSPGPSPTTPTATSSFQIPNTTPKIPGRAGTSIRRLRKTSLFGKKAAKPAAEVTPPVPSLPIAAKMMQMSIESPTPSIERVLPHDAVSATPAPALSAGATTESKTLLNRNRSQSTSSTTTARSLFTIKRTTSVKPAKMEDAAATKKSSGLSKLLTGSIKKKGNGEVEARLDA